MYDVFQGQGLTAQVEAMFLFLGLSSSSVSLPSKVASSKVTGREWVFTIISRMQKALRFERHVEPIT